MTTRQPYPDNARRAASSLLAMVLWAAAPSTARSQTEYYDLDAGRPVRVEDAVAIARNALQLSFPNLRIERYAGGSERLRLEPKLAFGVLPFTEIEVRVPI